jgi:hypothetical protein
VEVAVNWNVEYFVNSRVGAGDPSRPPGYVILSPYSGCPAPVGYARETANTMVEVEALDKTLRRQTELEFEREAERDASAFEEQRKGVMDRILAQMQGRGIDPSYQPYIRDFWTYYLKLRDDHPKKQYFANQLECYLSILHNMSDGRPENVESYDKERVEERAAKL